MPLFGQRGHLRRLQLSGVPGLAEVAVGQGWEPVPGRPFGSRLEDELGPLVVAMYGAPPDPAAGSPAASYTDAYRGTLEGREVVVANAWVTMPALDGFPAVEGVAVCSAELTSFADLVSVQPRAVPAVLARPQEPTGSTTFDSRFLVQAEAAPDPSGARHSRPGTIVARLLTPEVQQAILARDDWIFQIDGYLLACIVPRPFNSVTEVSERIAEVLAIAAAIPATMRAAELSEAIPVLPPAPGLAPAPAPAVAQAVAPAVAPVLDGPPPGSPAVLARVAAGAIPDDPVGGPDPLDLDVPWPAGDPYSSGEPGAASDPYSPGGSYSPGGPYSAGDLHSPGDAQFPGEAQFPEDSQSPGDLHSPGDSHSPGELPGPGSAYSPSGSWVPDDPFSWAEPETQPEPAAVPAEPVILSGYVIPPEAGPSGLPTRRRPAGPAPRSVASRSVAPHSVTADDTDVIPVLAAPVGQAAAPAALPVRLAALTSLDDALAMLAGLTPGERELLAELDTPLAALASAQTPQEATARYRTLDPQRKLQLAAMFMRAGDAARARR